MKVLVSGGAGFIGGHVVQQLVAAGARVAVIDDLSSGTRRNLRQAHQLGLAVDEVFATDVTKPDLRRLVDVWGPEVIVHLAAQADVRRSVQDPLRDAHTNVLGTLNVLTTAVAAGVRKVVVASSGGAVYGNLAHTAHTAREDHGLHPISPYGVSKAACDSYVEAFRQTTGLTATSLRIGNAYGLTAAGTPGSGVVSSFAMALADSQRPVIFGDGTQTRDFVHVTDIARAFVSACTDGDHQILNIASGLAHSIAGVLAAVSQAFGTSPNPVYEAVKPGEVHRICLDISRAERVLGWRPTVALPEGIREIADQLRSGAEPILTSTSTQEGC